MLKPVLYCFHGGCTDTEPSRRPRSTPVTAGAHRLINVEKHPDPLINRPRSTSVTAGAHRLINVEKHPDPLIRIIKECGPSKILVQDDNPDMERRDPIIRIIKDCTLPPPPELTKSRHPISREHANTEVRVHDKDPNFQIITQRKRSSANKGLERVIAEPIPTEREACCNICMEDKFSFEFFPIKGCPHTYCAACVSKYVASKVEENVTSIGCPDPKCKDGVLELEMCRLILPPTVFDRWGSILCERTLGQRKIYCPYRDCSAVLLDEGDDEGKPIVHTVCPHCLKWFCAQCKVPWHKGVTCKEFMSLGVDERGKEDLMVKEMAMNYKWQRCPKCRHYVEKTWGCNFVKCRCGFQFCYGCAREMMANNHYCLHCPESS